MTNALIAKNIHYGLRSKCILLNIKLKKGRQTKGMYKLETGMQTMEKLETTCFLVPGLRMCDMR